MSYELSHSTSRRAPKLTTPAVAQAYRKLPKEVERMSEKTAVEVVESVKSGELRVLRRWDEWLRVYMPWLVPADRKVMTYSDDMDEPCACARCGKRVTFGECYTSFQIHTILGIGYAVCPECHEREMAEREVAEKLREAVEHE